MNVVPSNVALAVTAIDFLIHDGTILYNFQVQFGRSHNWIVSKTYEAFALLHEELGKSYGFQSLPYLTGPVRPWAKNSKSTGVDRLPKLESYLMEVLAVWHTWQPSIYVVKVPNPDVAACRDSVFVNSFLFEFLEFEQFMVLPSAAQPTVEVDVAATPSLAAGSPVPSPGQSPRTEGAMPMPSSGSGEAEVEVGAAAASSDHIDNTDDIQTEASNVTKQIYLQIRNYTIYKDDRIDYHVHVTILGHHWILMKRYSEFAEFHKRLVAVYGEAQVPPIEESKAPAWRKLDPKTGLLRQKFFNSYLRAVVVTIDTWEPHNIVTRFQVGGVERDVCVCVNQLLFDFLGFEHHIQQFQLAQAEAALGKQLQQMTEKEKDVLERQRLNEQQAKVGAALAKRRAKLELFPSSSFDELVQLVSTMDDDKDISGLLAKVVASGCFPVDCGGDGELSPSVHYSPATPPNRTKAFPRSPRPRSQASGFAVVGFTSSQLAQLCKALYFNDTRVECVRQFVPLLVDLDALEDVLDTLLYHWEEMKAEVLANVAGS